MYVCVSNTLVCAPVWVRACLISNNCKVFISVPDMQRWCYCSGVSPVLARSLSPDAMVSNLRRWLAATIIRRINEENPLQLNYLLVKPLRISTIISLKVQRKSINLMANNSIYTLTLDIINLKNIYNIYYIKWNLFTKKAGKESESYRAP